MNEEQIPATRLESVEQLRARSMAERTPTLEESLLKPAEASVVPFRPTHRPPMALVCVLDDGSDDGRWVRVHSDEFVIGRVEGDLTVPYEDGMSTRHVLLRRVLEDGQFRWYLKDLGSTNGTFARIADAVLHDKQEILVGSHRYCLEIPPQTKAAVAAANQPESPVERNATQQWQTLPAMAARIEDVRLVKLASEGDVEQFWLDANEHWIGTDNKRCGIVVADDELVDPVHARVFKDEQGKWRIEDSDSLNGTWVRVDEVPVEESGSFQVGEQRFLIKIP